MGRVWHKPRDEEMRAELYACWYLTPDATPDADILADVQSDQFQSEIEREIQVQCREHRVEDFGAGGEEGETEVMKMGNGQPDGMIDYNLLVS